MAFESTIALPGKPPQLILPNLWAFPPNRDSLGGTAYLIQSPEGNVLVDAPPWTEATQAFLQQQGGLQYQSGLQHQGRVARLLLTHRTALAKISQIQAALDCEVVVQEQEAYLLPNLALTTFGPEWRLGTGAETEPALPNLGMIWTPGHSPGSSCVYWPDHGGVLFTGRTLLPTPQGDLLPLRNAKTFHWRRQLRSLSALRDRFSTVPLQYCCPGANLGFLRGAALVDRAYDRLVALDLAALDRVALDMAALDPTAPAILA